MAEHDERGIEDAGIRLSGSGVSRGDYDGKPRCKCQFLEDSVEAAIEVGHNGELVTLRFHGLEHIGNFRKHPPGRAGVVVIEKRGEEDLGGLIIMKHPTAFGDLPDDTSPPRTLSEVAIRMVCIVGRRGRMENPSECLADHALLHHEARRREMAGIHSGD